MTKDSAAQTGPRHAKLSPLAFALAFGAYSGAAMAALPTEFDSTSADEPAAWLVLWAEENAK